MAFVGGRADLKGAPCSREERRLLETRPAVGVHIVAGKVAGSDIVLCGNEEFVERCCIVLVAVYPLENVVVEL
jgi:hypothetical protein